MLGMGLFDNATTEQLTREQVRVDSSEGTIDVQYGQGQSANTKTQSMVQSTLLAELIFTTQQQNELLEEQNRLLKRQNQLLDERE